MKKVVDYAEWMEKAENFQKRIAENPYPQNLKYYSDLLSLVFVGESILDVGCGDCHIEKVIGPEKKYIGIDPFPRHEHVVKGSAEMLNYWPENRYDTTFVLAALDNCLDLELALQGIKKVTKKNIVIVTGLGIDPDDLHTVTVDRSDLVAAFGSPKLEKQLSKNVYLFEFLCQ